MGKHVPEPDGVVAISRETGTPNFPLWELLCDDEVGLVGEICYHIQNGSFGKRIASA